MYVADCNNYHIQKFSPHKNIRYMHYVGQFHTPAPNFNPGPEEHSYPVGIAIDTTATGDLVYVCDWGNHSVS